MPPPISATQIWGVHDIAGFLAAIETAQPAIAPSTSLLKAALGNYFAATHHRRKQMLNSDLENLLSTLVHLNPELEPAAEALCRCCNALLPTHEYRGNW